MAAGAGLDKTLSLSCKALDYQDSRVLSSGVPDRDLSDFPFWAMACASSLCLADINPEAVSACRRTIADNVLSDRVSVYCSDNLRDIPKSEQWDLVVSNPPHFIDEYLGNLRAHDPDWRVHLDFFRTVSPFLKPADVIILQENNAGSTVGNVSQQD